MRMLLRSEFPNGLFGDPALHIWDINGRNSFLFDCGDLSRFSIRQLLRVSCIFLSHCHMDHFFGFDFFLRAHMGVEKTIRVFGPPETTERVEGKLRGYTWNLLEERTESLDFIVTDVDPGKRKLHRVLFRSRHQFRPEAHATERWDPADPIHDAGPYGVRTAQLDHRTPSMAYLIEEKPAVGIDIEAMRRLKLKPGPWISELKQLFLFGGLETAMIGVTQVDGSGHTFNGADLARHVLLQQQRHKVAYATDGAANAQNWNELSALIEGADLFFAETCFLEAERQLADQTLHFTADYIGRLAHAARVKRLAPFHFSKRYVDRQENVLDEAARAFGGEILVAPSLETWRSPALGNAPLRA